jgi:hypothetical protein
MNNRDIFSEKLEQVRKRFEQWRQQNGKQRLRIPEELWYDLSCFASAIFPCPSLDYATTSDAIFAPNCIKAYVAALQFPHY